ncbi:MAG: GH92 family glycosyl hydrolase [Verrucomicrobiota bacterium]
MDTDFPTPFPLRVDSFSMSGVISTDGNAQRHKRGYPWRKRAGWLTLLLAITVQAAETRTPADYVNPLIDTHKSRWIFFSSACRPFGMVNLSPDTRTGGDWMCGYLYGDTKIRCFSHIHGWQLYGLPTMPMTGPMRGPDGMDVYASDFSHDDEIVQPGYHKVVLKTYGVTAELTSTARVGFHRYTFPEGQPAHIVLDTGAELMDAIATSTVHRVSDTELEGEAVMAPTSRRPTPFTVYFVAQFDKAFETFGGWTNKTLLPGTVETITGTNAGAYVSFSSKSRSVLMKVAISYTSLNGARRNLASELPHWDFDRVVRESREEWNRWLGRIEVTGGTEAQRIKFYTDLWHALLGRRTVSDVDGRYCDMTGAQPQIRRVALGADGQPRFPHYNFDALWGSQWSLALLWSFAYPEVMDGFCNTMVDMYRNGGLIPRGPAGGNYTFVMIGDQAAPFFAAAYAKNIRNYDVNKAYEGLRKNALPGGIRDHAGYEHGKNASGGGMNFYVERGYVPEGVGNRGLHRDGAAMTLEYAYEDWCVAQMSLALGHSEDAEWLLKRSQNYTNLWDASSGFMRPRLKNGSWLANFSPAGPKAAKGFCEANAAIYTHYVPHDLPGLIRLFGGSDRYVTALNRQFEVASTNHFAAEHDQHQFSWVDYDNQPSTAMAHLFNIAGAPWLSQKWVRAVKEQTCGNVTPYGGYNGDEDQGQMGALGVLMAIGRFDVQGGAARHPTYQITSPLFDRVTLHLDSHYFPGRSFTITTHANSPQNIYIQSARLNGRPLNQYWFSHEALVNGGELELELGPEPNRNWGVGKLNNGVN